MEYAQPQETSVGVDVSNRVRILEGKYNLTRDRMFLLNENMISHYKSLREESDILKSEIRELKETNLALKETISNLLKELDFFARKEHLKILEKYINMWNPLNFTTREEVLELLESNKKHSRKKTTKRKTTKKRK